MPTFDMTAEPPSEPPSEAKAKPAKLNIVVDADLRKKFKAACVLRGVSMHDLITDFMRSYAESDTLTSA